MVFYKVQYLQMKEEIFELENTRSGACLLIVLTWCIH